MLTELSEKISMLAMDTSGSKKCLCVCLGATKNNLFAQYAQYMFKVNAQAAFLSILNNFSMGVNFKDIRT